MYPDDKEICVSRRQRDLCIQTTKRFVYPDDKEICVSRRQRDLCIQTTKRFVYEEQSNNRMS